MRQNRPKGVALVGPGRIGQALGRLLANAGASIDWIAARRLSAARNAARFIGAGHAVALGSAELNRARVLLITTSDSALPEVARSLAGQRANWKGCVVLHTSGAWPGGGDSSVLQPLRRRGASAGSLHPLQTVPGREAGVRNLIGCSWAVEGDAGAVRLARGWVRLLRGTVLKIDSQHKAAYHAAAVMACGGVVALMDAAERLMISAGVPPAHVRKMLGRFVAETAMNFEKLGARSALTGPAVRGDWATIRKHRAALRRHAACLAPLYRELLRAMMRIVGPGAASRGTSPEHRHR
jgi:predicted short-subunit dehydrogenase-like oxidoreductase (DUF2520 family)